MTVKRGLGRGLGALINDGIRIEPEAEAADKGIRRIAVSALRVNPSQPRRRFEEGPLEELAASVREHGILQPLLVREVAPDTFELIAGERRLRAARLAGLTDVPVMVTRAGETESLEMALIENLQRENLNPIEEAEGYRALAERFGMTQERIAERVGRSRAAVANALRLLSLPDDVRRAVAEDRLSAGHAKVLAGLDRADAQSEFARRALEESLSVRELERAIERESRIPRKPRAARSDIPSTHLAYLSDRLHARLGTAVRLTPCRTYANGKKGKGHLEIEFYSNEELSRILDILGVVEE